MCGKKGKWFQQPLLDSDWDGLVLWCSAAFILHFWDPGIHVRWWLYSPVNNFWNVFVAVYYPHMKASDLFRTLSEWDILDLVCILREKFRQWAQRPTGFWMLGFWGMLSPVLCKCKCKFNSLWNTVLLTSVCIVNTDSDISRAGVTGTR